MIKKTSSTLNLNSNFTPLLELATMPTIFSPAGGKANALDFTVIDNIAT